MTEQLQPEQAPPAQLNVGDTVALAVGLHRAGRVDEALVLYGRILEIDPEQPDALHFLGVATLYRGRIDAGLALINKSIAVGPPHADRYSNLGNALLVSGRADEATEAYRKAISLNPALANAHMNLGVILSAQKRFDEAAAAYKRAIELEPELADAYYNCGNLYLRQGHSTQAVEYYSKALVLQPEDRRSAQLLARSYIALGEMDKAAEIYRAWLEQEPDDPQVKHLLAACSGSDVPERASDAYVERAFDTFARTFEARLAHLEYRAPQLVADALARACHGPCKSLYALDAGCGTGLCGRLIVAYASRLEGVDLSSGMLEEARKTGVYDELTKAELTSFIAGHARNLDLIISADTLVYFGPLASVFAAAYGALRPGGLLIFSVEELVDHDGRGYRIQPHGRYSHSDGYIERTLSNAGFAGIVIDRAVLRVECGVPVDGLIVTARKDSVEQRAKTDSVSQPR
jgi:predicted TPR repeat methyltransferase